jgi:tetratricopeptide (TPR) repeat protein
VFLKRGITYGLKNDFQQAIKDLNQAIKLNPKLARAYTNRGNIYNAMNTNDLAIADYDTAINIDPNDFLPFINRGVVYKSMGEIERSKSDIEAGLSLISNLQEREAFYNQLKADDSYNGALIS